MGENASLYVIILGWGYSQKMSDSQVSRARLLFNIEVKKRLYITS